MKYPDLNGLTVCRALLDDPVISKLAEMQESCNEKVSGEEKDRNETVAADQSDLAYRLS